MGKFIYFYKKKKKNEQCHLLPQFSDLTVSDWMQSKI
jgi:hypothetical protein